MALAPAEGSLSGSVHGGQPPISGSHVYLFEVGTTSYGSAASNIVNTTGSAGKDAYGNYVLTNTSGSFSLPGTQYTCTKAANQTYLLASGGNPGLTGTVNNTAITLILALGKCGNITSLPNVIVNEISTAAGVTALQQFMTGPGAIGAPSTNKAGLVIASGLANDLIRVSSSIAANINQAGTGSVPQAKLNTLGNILAPCINSAGPTSSDCTNLFTAVTPAGGTAPTDVASAMLLIAQNPNNNVGTLYTLPNGTPNFQPSLATAPNDWSIGITYTNSNMTSPQNVAIDAAGDAWIANAPSNPQVNNGQTPGTDSIVEFTNSGATSNYTSNITTPLGLAFDGNNNLWVTNAGGASVTEMTNGAFDGNFTGAGFFVPVGVAIDASNNVWVTDEARNNIEELNSSGTFVRTVTPASPFRQPVGVAIENGTVFVVSAGSNAIAAITASSGAITATYTGNGLSTPEGLSIDNAHNLFSVNDSSSLVSEINDQTGNSTGASPYAVSVSNASTVAIDGFSTGWIANCESCSQPQVADNLLHISVAGANIGSKAGIQDTNTVNPTVAAIDGSGNVWTTNVGTASVTEFLGVAGPVVTPLAVASSTAKLGTRP